MTESTPSPSRPRLAHVPALDGLRGLAVVAVLAFHGGFSWAVGGYLGVSAFFTLSGFLITSLLIVEWDATGAISLRGFWGRRFRRLLPAALVVLAAVALTALLAADSGQLANLRADMLAALGNVANWRFVLDERSYAELFTGPSPLQHYWSLSIEEQFYVLFPLATAGLLRVWKGRRAPLAAIFAALATASLAWSWSLTATPSGTDRAYYDTGARAAELLAGALLALALADRARRVERRPRLVAASGTGALALLASAWVLVPQSTTALYRGGLVLHAGLVVVVLTAAHVPGPVRSFCSLRPLRSAGKLSYGLYLIHWPVFVWLDEARTGTEGLPLFAVRMAVTIALAWASYVVVEQPVRLGRVLPGRTAVAGMAMAALVVVGLAVVVPTTARPADDITLALQGLRAADAPPPPMATAALGDAGVEVAGPTQSRPADATPVAPAASRAPADGDADAVTASQPIASTATPAPRRVLLVGDSVMSQAMAELEPRFAAEGITVDYAGGPASGPLSPQGSWAGQIDAWVAGTDPDVVVIEACCNYTYEPPTRYVTPEGDQVAPDTPAVLEAWEREMRDLVRRAGAGGARVFLVRFPPVLTNGFYGPIEDHVTKVNHLYARMVADTPGLGLVDWSATLSPDGSFSSDLVDRGGRRVPVRLDDGVHLTPAGSGMVAEATLVAVIA